MAVVIAGERSGAGKTTVTLSLLAALQRQQFTVQSFKVGPDYIDPMFHHYITRRACRNLDPVLTSEAYVCQCFYTHQHNVDYALVEGVMGLFDGAGTDDRASTAHIARLLNLPILLVLDCSRLSRSIAALVHGYCTFDPRLQFAGLVLNRVGSDRHLAVLKSALEPLGLPILGVLRRHDEITIPDRHLGLVPTAELPDLDALIDRFADLGKQCFNWNILLPLLRPSFNQAPYFSLPIPHSPLPTPQSPRVAIAYDRAFNFYYADNLELLQQFGAALVWWSPLTEPFPQPIHGLYLGGGFPEVFAQPLSANRAARLAVKAAIEAGMPTYAECGGLMYLSKQLVDFDNRPWDMVGVLPTIARMEKRLTLGYRRAVSLPNNLFVAPETVTWGHEFHRSVVLGQSDAPLYQIQGYDPQSSFSLEGWRIHQVHASYVHLHWGANPEIPDRFVRSCLEYAQLKQA
ncbi:cobyrinate a,c-diamide synthase [Thermocoleostomius sinensis]|uniref:Cobyrinate a,c-diamide synthase n=1 Tax=Thermocoleostomius sinensis A174 TaxID=2016057 RepID=A0A9E8ZB96_9CYAN|nr:cobyrinate a,c-diamide synthase [Thermocoleostomius sinensis]WAL59661.1 cobyrinate a,c-diamide synthase [Thermocoleostomius sinensis A174]